MDFWFDFFLMFICLLFAFAWNHSDLRQLCVEKIKCDFFVFHEIRINTFRNKRKSIIWKKKQIQRVFCHADDFALQNNGSGPLFQKRKHRHLIIKIFENYLTLCMNTGTMPKQGTVVYICLTYLLFKKTCKFWHLRWKLWKKFCFFCFFANIICHWSLPFIFLQHGRREFLFEET